MFIKFKNEIINTDKITHVQRCNYKYSDLANPQAVYHALVYFIKGNYIDLSSENEDLIDTFCEKLLTITQNVI